MVHAFRSLTLRFTIVQSPQIGFASIGSELFPTGKVTLGEEDFYKEAKGTAARIQQLTTADKQ